MSHILKGLSKRNTHIPHIALFDEDTWHKRCSNAYFRGFRGGGHFWRVTQQMLCERSHMLVGAKICELTDGFLWFVCGLYVGILTSPLSITKRDHL